MNTDTMELNLNEMAMVIGGAVGGMVAGGIAGEGAAGKAAVT